MRRILLATVLASLAAGPGLTTVAHAQAPAAEPAQYSVAETPAGKMIDDPRAAAILQELIPTIWANEMFQSAGRELPLKAIQQYEPILTDQKLAEIQAALDKLSESK